MPAGMRASTTTHGCADRNGGASEAEPAGLVAGERRHRRPDRAIRPSADRNSSCREPPSGRLAQQMVHPHRIDADARVGARGLGEGQHRASERRPLLGPGARPRSRRPRSRPAPHVGASGPPARAGRRAPGQHPPGRQPQRVTPPGVMALVREDGLQGPLVENRQRADGHVHAPAATGRRRRRAGAHRRRRARRFREVAAPSPADGAGACGAVTSPNHAGRAVRATTARRALRGPRSTIAARLAAG